MTRGASGVRFFFPAGGVTEKASMGKLLVYATCTIAMASLVHGPFLASEQDCPPPIPGESYSEYQRQHAQWLKDGPCFNIR